MLRAQRSIQGTVNERPQARVEAALQAAKPAAFLLVLERANPSVRKVVGKYEQRLDQREDEHDNDDSGDIPHDLAEHTWHRE